MSNTDTKTMSWNDLPRLVKNADSILDAASRDPVTGGGAASMTPVGDEHEHATAQAALDELDEWEGARIVFTESYDERQEQFPIEVTGRKNRIILMDNRHRTIGTSISEPVEAVIKFDTGLHQHPGVALYNLQLDGNGYAKHCILGVSERRTFYENVLCGGAREHGIYHTRNDQGHAMNTHTWHGVTVRECGGDGFRIDDGAHGVTMYDCEAHANAGYGANIGSAASCQVYGGAYQNNGLAGIISQGYWDFHVDGAYFERIGGASDDQHAAEIVIRNHYVASVRKCYGNGGDQTGHMVLLDGVNRAELSGCLGYRYTRPLFGFDGCDDVDLNIHTCDWRGSNGPDAVVDPEHFANEVYRPRVGGVIGAGAVPLGGRDGGMPDGLFEGDVALHPENGFVAWRSGEWAVQGVGNGAADG